MNLREAMAGAASVIRQAAGAGFTPEIGVVLGTGLGHLADSIERVATVEYGDIPGFPLSTVESHKGRLILNVVPFPGSDCSTNTFPLWYSRTIRFTSDRPSPQPRFLVV